MLCAIASIASRIAVRPALSSGRYWRLTSAYRVAFPGALFTRHKGGCDVARIVDGVVEVQAACLVAEVVDADCKDVQHRARRLRAARRDLHRQTGGRDVRDPERARSFEFVQNERQSVGAMQSRNGRNGHRGRCAVGTVINHPFQHVLGAGVAS